MEKTKIYKYIYTVLLFTFLSAYAQSQNFFVPSAQGAWGNAFYSGIGLTKYPTTYNKKIDGIASVGIGFGHPVNNIGVQLHTNILGFKTFSKYSMGFKIHKYFGGGFFFALGVDNALADKMGEGSNSPASQYICLTQDFKYKLQPMHPLSKLSYTIGFGNGKFSQLTDYQVSESQGWSGIPNFTPSSIRYGTFIFASVHYNIIKKLGITIEWSGLNLNAGVSYQMKVLTIPFKVAVGVADLTKFTGAGMRFIGGLTIGYQVPYTGRTQIPNEEYNNNTKKQDALTDKDIDKIKELLEVHQAETMSKVTTVMDNKLNDYKSELTANNNNNGGNNNFNNNNENNNNGGNNNLNNNTNNTLPENAEADDVRMLSHEAIKQFDKDSGIGPRLTSGIYIILYSFKTEAYAERALTAIKSDGFSDAGMAYNNTRGWYYVYAEIFKINQLNQAISRNAELRTRGYTGWILYFN